MKCRKAYAIIPVGENDRSAHVAQQKAPDLQRYFRDRAAVVKKHLDEIRAREEEELSDYCSDRDGGRYDAEVANGRGYYDASGKFHYHHVPNDEW